MMSKSYEEYSLNEINVLSDLIDDMVKNPYSYYEDEIDSCIYQLEQLLNAFNISNLRLIK